jgi:hypothetical protein
MFVAAHKEGKDEVRKLLKRSRAQVMLEVPDRRMGHKEAWWPLDKFNFNADRLGRSAEGTGQRK